MVDELKELAEAAKKEIEKIADSKAAEDLRVKYLGRKAKITQALRSLKDLSIEEKRKIGPEIQKIRQELEELVGRRLEEVSKTVETKIGSLIDLTAPGRKLSIGHSDPLTRIEEEVRQIFLSMNFSVVEGPEIEREYYNFDALNIPKNHPARDGWNTFWLKTQADKDLTQAKVKKTSRESALLLRTHTSPMQIRYMETHEPPFQIIVPGRVFRYEASDFSHEINFHQIEGLMVGEDVSLANLKFVIEEFFKKLFAGKKIEFRFRPGYFPFVEPGLEADIKLKDKWLEVLGAGMVHRNVLKAVGYDPKKVQGFAFGMGWERLAMIKYNIPDIRLFFSGDLRFIKQF